MNLDFTSNKPTRYLLEYDDFWWFYCDINTHIEPLYAPKINALD